MQLLILAILLSVAESKIYFHETFDDDWTTTWRESKKSDSGKFETALPKYAVNQTDKWLKTPQDARFYHAAAAFSDSLNTAKETFIIQYAVDFEQDIDCGGGYLKIFRPGVDLEKFDGSSEYAIMFGPDVCGYDTKMTHFILNYKNSNHLIKNKISFYPDTKPHIFTLIMRPDATYEVILDGEVKSSGKLVDNWDLLPPKQIPDPNDKKPEDWVDEKEIPDTNEEKPEDWDQPENIVDSAAKKPEDWKDEEDGEWSPPMIKNPAFKGEWKPKMIPNPKYNGEWVQKQMDNPEYADDPTIGQYELGGVGIDVWQVKSGSLFNEILVTNDEEEAKEHRKHLTTMFDALSKSVDAAKKKEEDERREREKNEPKSADSENKASDESVKDDYKSGKADSGDDHEDSEAKKDHDEL